MGMYLYIMMYEVLCFERLVMFSKFSRTLCLMLCYCCMYVFLLVCLSLSLLSDVPNQFFVLCLSYGAHFNFNFLKNQCTPVSASSDLSLYNWVVCAQPWTEALCFKIPKLSNFFHFGLLGGLLALITIILSFIPW